MPKYRGLEDNILFSSSSGERESRVSISIHLARKKDVHSICKLLIGESPALLSILVLLKPNKFSSFPIVSNTHAKDLQMRHCGGLGLIQSSEQRPR